MLIELYGTLTLCQSLLHLILSNVRTKLDTNGTNNKKLNKLHYNKTFTLLDDRYFQERLEQYQTPFTVYQINKMCTGTLTFMPADKNGIYDPSRNPYHNFPTHHLLEDNFVS